MNTTVQALQELYVKLGGSLTDTYATIANGIPVSDYVTIPDVINAIEEVASSGGGGGGSSLPAVTAADNDKVLTVVEGAWDKAVSSGGVYIVHASIKWEEAGTSSGFVIDTVEEDIADVIAAINGGKIVEMHVANSGYEQNPHTDFEVYSLIDAYLGDSENAQIDFGIELRLDFSTNTFKSSSVSYLDGAWVYGESTKVIS